jgi:acyl carrier protein
LSYVGEGIRADMDHPDLEAELRSLIINRIAPEGRRSLSIADEDDLFEGALGLDSLDGLRLVAIVEKQYGVRLGSDDAGTREAIRSIRSLAGVVRGARGSSARP